MIQRGSLALRRGARAHLRGELGSAWTGLRELAAGDRAVRGVVAVFALSQLVFATWDLPSSHGWENDGIAPRDLFGGLAANLTPGGAHRYPILHYLLVLALSAPALLVGAVTAGSLDLAEIQRSVLSTWVMTAVSVAAKALSVGMACVVMLVVASWARRFHSARAALATALLLATCRSFTYYGRTSNLDVPYCFWLVLALDRLVAFSSGGNTRDIVRFGVLVGASVATKDQAYGAALGAGAAYLVSSGTGGAREIVSRLRNLVTAVVAALVSYAVLSLSILNPAGLLARIRLVTGTNSQDWRVYQRSPAGLLANLDDLARAQQDFWWAWPAVAMAWVGVALVIMRPARSSEPGPHPGACLPLGAGAGSVLFFALVVARGEARFVLPLGIVLALHGGVAAAELITLAGRVSARPVANALLVALAAWSGARSGALGLTQLRDARSQVEVFLARLPRGSLVETHGLTVYQPRFDVSRESPYRVERVDSTSPRSRNPLPGVGESQATLASYTERRPDVIVIPEAYSGRFLERPALAGRTPSRHTNAEARWFFTAATADGLPGYAVCLRAGPPVGPLWKLLGPLKLHGSVGVTVLALCREGVRVLP